MALTQDIKGRIHSIETFGTVDGPGIRYVVFMQGCPLRCIYCHNRDSWDVKGGKEVTVNEIIEDLKEYVEFIKFSGGGITATGGEPTLQPEFIRELFKRCKDIGINTALDTSGFVDVDKVQDVLKYTDLVLLDIKHAINEQHKIITGVENKKIYTFVEYLDKQNIDIWIRYVLIPGYTDHIEHLNAAAEFIGQLNNVKKVEVLPYHAMGEYKWDKLGEEYMLHGVESPKDEQVEKAQKILEGGLKV